MTYPRAHLIDPDNDATYHLYTRCVRRAWLCGVDPQSGNSYEHRKDWLEERILKMAGAFSISLFSYAIMSNHYHTVIRSHPKAPLEWSDEEVAERWFQASYSNNEEKKLADKAALLDDTEQLGELRRRLGDVSWFMRYINEPLARMSNKEDGCKGTFVESRFKSSALLDEPALRRCMVYVDLNPVRVGITDSPTQGPHTSLKRRCENKSDCTPLAPLSALEWTLEAYIDLVQWTADEKPMSSNVRQSQYIAHPTLGVGCSRQEWQDQVNANRHKYRAYGEPSVMREYVASIGQRWIKGSSSAPPS